MKLLVAILSGAVLGVIGSRYLFVGSWLSLIPWGIAGLALGLWCATLRQAISVGAAFGFALAFVFMIAGYAGAAPVVTRLLPFAALGAVGAVCGLALGALGHLVRARLTR